MDDAAMAEVFRRLAVEAGAAIMQVRATGDQGVRTKADDSPVTRADLAADAIICDGLHAAFPGVPIVTEERAEPAGADGRYFLVDPLDGTREFVRGRDEFTVNIALVEDGRPRAGVVFAPAIGRLFRTDPVRGAIEETGAFHPAVEGSTRAIRVSPARFDPLRVVISASHLDPQTRAYLDALGTIRAVSAGSSLKFCALAAGEADLYPRFGPTMEWDTAAGHAVLLAAGGRVVAAPDCGPLLYGKRDRRNSGFIASGPFDAPAAPDLLPTPPAT